MSILVVGSIALDTVETPFGRVERALGGSAIYFSVAASLYAPVNLVGVVGSDFPVEHRELLRSRGIDTRGLQVTEGRTFSWSGRYDFDLNVAHTLETQLNVFADFHPCLPDGYADSPFVLLANIAPDLQVEVLEQTRAPRLTALDTMNYWIENRREALTRAISMVDVVLMNEAEVRQFTGCYSLVRAAQQVLALGPRALVVKKGEYGAVLFGDGIYFVAPAYPLEAVKDPTGAGDSFAGGFMGHLARAQEVTSAEIRKAMVHGSVVASFAVEDFGIERLKTLSIEELKRRYQEFKHFTHFEQL